MTQMSGSDAISVITILVVVAIISSLVWSRIDKYEERKINSSTRKLRDINEHLGSREIIIRDYGALMARRPSISTRIEDISVLPHSKEMILEALLSEIRLKPSAQLEGVMELAAISLAQYQSGVGSEPLDMLGVDITKFPETRDLNLLQEQANLMLEAQRKTQHRFDEFNKLVRRDLQQITSKIADAKSSR